MDFWRKGKASDRNPCSLYSGVSVVFCTGTEPFIINKSMGTLLGQFVWSVFSNGYIGRIRKGNYVAILLKVSSDSPPTRHTFFHVIVFIHGHSHSLANPSSCAKSAWKDGGFCRQPLFLSVRARGTKIHIVFFSQTFLEMKMEVEWKQNLEM